MTGQIDDLPKIVSVDTADLAGLGGQAIRPFRKAGFVMMFASRFSDQADRQYMSEPHCLLYLHRRVASARQAADRGRHLFGRIYNALTGADPDYILLTGHVLDTVLRVAEEPRLDADQRLGTYQVRRDVAERLLDVFTEKMKMAGHLA